MKTVVTDDPLVVGANFALATVPVIPSVVPLLPVLLAASLAWSLRRNARSGGSALVAALAAV